MCCLIDVRLEIIFVTDLRQIRELQLAMPHPMGEVFQCLVTGLGSLILALYFSWNLTLVIICTMPIVYLFMAFLSTRMEPNVHKQGEKLQEVLKYVTNAFQSIEMVKSFNGQDSGLWRYCRAIKGAAKYYIRQSKSPISSDGFHATRNAWGVCTRILVWRFAC